MAVAEKLAIDGGSKTVEEGMVKSWPPHDERDRQAIMDVFDSDVFHGNSAPHALEMQEKWAEYCGCKYALVTNSGTSALHMAVAAAGVLPGDEVITSAFSFWASAAAILHHCAIPTFVDIDPVYYTIDPAKIEAAITPRTTAIMPVHIHGMPCNLGPIMEIAEKHDLKVIEDASHAHGGLYRGRLVGTIGHVSCMSVMSGKSLAVGEGGMMLTNDRQIWERCIAWGHYARTTATQWTGELKEQVITEPDLAPFTGLPWGGVKYRMHQMSSAVGRVQLKYYQERMEEIQRAMNYFWDLLEDVPGVKAHRPPQDEDSTMGGWYAAHGLYVAEELDGLPLSTFAEAVRAEGGTCSPGANLALHLHPQR